MHSDSRACDFARDLPRDFATPVAPRFHRAGTHLSIPRIDAERVSHLAEGAGLAGFVPWCAALGIALARYSGQESLKLAVVVRRDEPGAVGRPLDICAVPVGERPSMTVRALLSALDESLSAALNGPPGAAPGPLGPVTVSAVGMSTATSSGITAAADRDGIASELFEYELNFTVAADGPTELRLECEYDSDLYEQATIAGMLHSWAHLALTLPHALDLDPTELDLWSHDAMATWARRLAGPKTELPEVTIDGLVRAQATRTPDATALESGQARLSYRELQARVDAVAAAIRQRGINPGARIVVCMTRSVDLVSVLLGVMSAGCTYVPIDPTHPKKRFAFILNDAQASLVISDQPHLFASACDGTGHEQYPCIAPATLLDASAAGSGQRHAVDLAAAAYLIYTSGSTGQPKGVVIGHRAAVNLLLAVADRSQLKAGETWLAITTPSFDISVAELFVPLIVGGTVWIADRETVEDPWALRQLIDRVDPVLMQATPATWRMLLAARWPGKSGLTAISTGEALDEKLATQLADRVGRLCNLYGPTEATVFTTWQDIGGRGRVFIGTPLVNTELHILDPRGNAVCPGVAGELYIGGAGLAEGYYGRDDLTRERFADHVLADGRTVRLYRTGDLVRSNANGAIRWLGRLDNQVKLRGFRIELGEIEAAIGKLPGVRQAVASIEAFGDDDRRLVARIVPDGPQLPTWRTDIRDALRETLPVYMIPSAIEQIDHIPLTQSGKVDRNAFRALRFTSDEDVLSGRAQAGDALSRVLQIWQAVLKSTDIGARDNFFDLGGHSLLLFEMEVEIERVFGVRIPRVEFFRNPTATSLAALIEHLGGSRPNPAPSTAAERFESPGNAASRCVDIAVVGIGLRVPGASTPQAFWRNIREGVESRTSFSEAQLLAAGVEPTLLNNKHYVRAGFVLENIAGFDAGFFGMSPREAEILDPQHRIFLECACEALEDAGVDPHTQGAGIGIYAGSDSSHYHATVLRKRESGLEPASLFQIRISNEKDHLPTRTSYRLNCRGPSVNVQTACSTSLVAVHLAVQSLLRGECDTALAGGVCVHVPHEVGYLHQDGMIASPDGHCRAFDRAAAGTVFGSGAGVVVLKRLEDAVAAGDRIYGVVMGSAINNDGGSKVGYTAPSVDGQAAVIAEAQRVAGVAAREIGYVEAHGTATPLGDPIEIAGLTQAFGKSTSDTQFCAIGSVKTNIGHLDQAAGVAGFIKALLAVYHSEIPPSLHYVENNPDIDFASTPFFVNTAVRPWPAGRDDARRIAGVSSFGVGGTNAHVIIGCAPPLPPSSAEAAAASSAAAAGASLVVLSGRSEAALVAQAERFGAFIAARPELALADIGFTANAGRSAFEHRAAWVVRDTADLVEQLGAFASGQERPSWGRGVYRNRPPRVAMLFTGQGAQYSGMGRELYAGEPVFRAAIDECAGLLEGQLDIGLVALLHEAGADLLDRTDLTQPALFALAYALRRTWAAWGVTPDVVLGHSVGEYAAAQAAGVFSLADGLRLVAARGRLMRRCCRPGAMLSIAADAAVVAGALAREAEVEAGEAGAGLALAAVNGPLQHVVAGERAAIERLQARLAEQGVRAEVLPGSHAFHSSLIEPMLAPFAEVLASVTLSPPTMPLVSNARATVVGAEMADPAYWIEHTRAPVQFARSLERLPQHGIDALLEIGPRPTLTALARHTLDDQHLTMLASLRAGRSDTEQMLESLAALHVRGTKVDWNGFHRNRNARKITLPTYPFQRQRHWVEHTNQEPMGALVATVPVAGDHSLLGRRLRLPHSTELRFEAEFRPDWPSYIDHHRLFGAMVVPGASHIAMFLAAAGIAFGRPACAVEDIAFLRPFVMPEQGRRPVQVVLRPNDEGSNTLQMMSLTGQRDADDDASWTVHVEARRVFGSDTLPTVPQAAELNVVKSRCTEYLSGADFYSKVWIPGMDTGDSFRWIDEIWRGDGEALCRTKRPPMVDTIDGPLHAGLVESGFQLLNSCWQFSTAELLSTNYIYVPFSIDSYRLFEAPASDRLWVHARIVRQGDGGEHGITAEIRMFDESGRIVANVQGFEVRRLDRSAVQALLHGDAAANLYAKQWKAANIATAEVDGAADPARVLLVGGCDAMVAALTNRFSAGGTPCSHITDPVAFSRNDRSDADAPLDDRMAWHAALAQVPPHASHDVIDIVDLRALTVPNDVPPLSRQRIQCGGVLSLVHGLAEFPGGVRLTIVTNGAQAIGEKVPIANAQQATLLGLARSIASEYPEWECRSVDLDPSLDPAAQSEALHVAIRGMRDEPEAAIRAGAILVPRLVSAKARPTTPPNIRADATYLVTGGLGDLGLRTARQLEVAGASRIVLLARSAGSQAASDAVAQLRERGCSVEVVRCDVADVAALQSVWKDIAGCPGFPLKGVFHAAGSLDDGVLSGQSWQQFSGPLHAKVVGTMNLHELCGDVPLDYFVCFSSISALLGTAGQANYAAANAFMDALAAARASWDQPALSMQWGPFAEVGMAARLDRTHRERASSRGLHAMSPDDILQHVQMAWRCDVATVVAANVDWPRYAQTEHLTAIRALLGNWLVQSPSVTGGAATAGTVRRAFDDMALSALKPAIADYLQERLAAMLGIGAAEIDRTRGFLDLGLDSLAAIELRSTLQRELQLSIPATFAFDFANVELGAAYLFDRMQAERASDDGEDGRGALDDADLDDDDLAKELARLESSLQR